MSVLNILVFLQDKISQLQKRVKSQVQVFYIKCHLKVDLALFTYIYIYNNHDY